MSAKKNFKSDNPAMQFIGQSALVVTPTAVVPEVDAAPQPAVAVPMKPNPLYIETKSKRLNLLLQPSLYESIKKVAKKNKNSVNETIHQVLQDYINNISIK